MPHIKKPRHKTRLFFVQGWPCQNTELHAQLQLSSNDADVLPALCALHFKLNSAWSRCEDCVILT